MKSLLTFGGLLIGGVIAYLTRPALPLLGQPSLSAAMQSLNSGAAWERDFAQQTLFHVASGLAIGGVIGLILAAIIGKMRPAHQS